MSDGYPDVEGANQFDFESPREETDVEAIARYANRAQPHDVRIRTSE